MITIEEFEQVEIHVGRVVAAEPFPEARRPAYKLVLDFGESIGIKRSSAQITARYSPEDLIGRLVLGCTNLTPRRVAGFVSEVLVLGVYNDAGEVVLIRPDEDVPLGTRLS